LPTIQEEVEDLEPVKIIEQRTRGKKFVGSSGSIPVQPKISKKKRTSVRKLRESYNTSCKKKKMWKLVGW